MEGVLQKMNYANFWRRFWGLMIDVMITMPFGWLIFKSDVSKYFVLPQIPHVLFQGIYYVAFWIIKSATPGMMLMKIKIVTDGGSLALWRGVLRYVGLCLSSVSWGLGGLWMLWDKRRQTWQDKMARTFVVKVD